jgi:hypothetical protein
MSDDTKRKVIKDCNITLSYYYVILSKLRKNKILVDERINPKFIPKLPHDAKDFQLLLLFDLE